MKGDELIAGQTSFAERGELEFARARQQDTECGGSNTSVLKRQILRLYVVFIGPILDFQITMGKAQSKGSMDITSTPRKATAVTDANGKTTEEKVDVDETTKINGDVKEEIISANGDSAKNGDLNGEAKKEPLESAEKENETPADVTKEDGDVTLEGDKTKGENFLTSCSLTYVEGIYGFVFSDEANESKTKSSMKDKIKKKLSFRSVNLMKRKAKGDSAKKAEEENADSSRIEENGEKKEEASEEKEEAAKTEEATPEKASDETPKAEDATPEKPTEDAEVAAPKEEEAAAVTEETPATATEEKSEEATEEKKPEEATEE